jgi:glycosyltransferase involved in cell wall biosynthesis
MSSIVLIVPGRLDTPTGGYVYDRRIAVGLRSRGWSVDVRELGGSFPWPTAAARREAEALLASLADGSTVVVDGLAFGTLPEELAPHAERLRLVALVHHPLAAETGLTPEESSQLRDSERRALPSARRVIVTSRATAGLLAAYDVDPQRIDVVVPGTDPAPIAPGSQGDDVHLLCVATLIPRKGHDVLFRALAALQPTAHVSGRRWRLTCVGSLDRDPVTAERLRRQLRELELSDRVHLAGERDADALAGDYGSSDVFVLPTLYEGYGMAVAEALARGLPVIATPTGAIPEIVPPDSGILVEPGDVEGLTDALRRVVGDDALRRRLSDGARRQRRRLPGWDQSCALMAEVLEQAGA